MAELKVTVIGGSIVGTATALMLQHNGIDACVYEADPRHAANRAGGVLGLEHTALDALEHKAGIPQDEIVTATSDTETVVNLTLSNKTVLQRRSCKYPGRTTTWTACFRAMLDRLAPGTYHPGHRITDVIEDAVGGVPVARLHFANGATNTADVIVFADGRNSWGRRHFDPTRRLHYAGYVAHRGLADQCPPDLAHAFVRQQAPGATAFNTFPVNGVGIDWTLYLNQSPALYEQHFGALPDELTFAFPRKITDDVRRFVDAAARQLLPAKEADVVERTRERMAVPVVDVDPPTRMVWPVGRSRVLLLGDALGTVHPSTARGANAGIEQAEDLEKVLHQIVRWGADTDAALSAMERRQLRSVQSAVREGPILGARMGLGWES